jgi:DNA repair protein RadC
MSMEKLNINEWAEEDRPREKLMRLGADALSNAELLAILIGSGSTKETAVELMKRVLNECDIMRIHLLDHVIVTDGNYYSYHEKGRL